MQTTKRKQVTNVFLCSIASRWVEGGKIACRSLEPDLIQTLARLEQFRLLTQTAFKVRLPAVRRSDWSLKSLKVFCEGILDSDCHYHDWRTSLLQQHAPRHARVSVSASLFLFRKVIPKPMSKDEVKKAVASYIDKMTSPSPPLEKSFVLHSQRWMEKLFPKGWDKNWQGFVDSFTLPTSSCIQRTRMAGGSRGGDRDALRADFRAFTEGRKVDPLGKETIPLMIWTGGKWRLVTKFSDRRSFLAPLHRTIYGHLSKRNWLLRGEATRDEFEEFRKVDGEIFVSGDYESATDNLNIEMTHLILDELRKTSSHVPSSVWTEARKALVNQFPDGRMQRTGQLMGSLLSFPLLCITNFLTFKWAIPRKVPLKVNGDDIVFRCSHEEKDKWFQTVNAAGLVVSRGKTLVLKSGFSLNSTFFTSTHSNVEVRPVIRSTCLFGTVEDPNQISGRLKGVYAGGGLVGEQIRAFALRQMSKQIWSSQRSVRRGLGAITSWRSLAWAGLAERETFYNELGAMSMWRSCAGKLVHTATLQFNPDPEIDLPVKKKEWFQNAIPSGYRREKTHDHNKQDDPDFLKDMIDCCWSRDPKVASKQGVSDYWETVRAGTFKYVPPPPKKFARWAGMSEQEADAYYCRRTNTERDNRKRVWVKVPTENLPSGEGE